MTNFKNDNISTGITPITEDLKNEIKAVECRSKKKLNMVEKYLYKQIYRSGNSVVDQIEDYIDNKADTMIEIIRSSKDQLESGNIISKFILGAVIVSTVISLASLVVMVSIFLHVK